MSLSNSPIMISDNNSNLAISQKSPVKPITLTIIPVSNGTPLPQMQTQLTGTQTLRHHN